MLESQLESLAISGETLTNLCERCQRSQNKMRVSNTMNICEVGIDTLDAFRLTRFQCDVAVFGLGSSKKEIVLWLSRAKFNACHLHPIQTQTLYFFYQILFEHTSRRIILVIFWDTRISKERDFYMTSNRRARSLDQRQMDVIALCVRVHCCVLCMLGYPLLGPPCVKHLTGPVVGLLHYTTLNRTGP